MLEAQLRGVEERVYRQPQHRQHVADLQLGCGLVPEVETFCAAAAPSEGAILCAHEG